MDDGPELISLLGFSAVLGAGVAVITYLSVLGMSGHPAASILAMMLAIVGSIAHFVGIARLVRKRRAARETPPG